MLGWYAERPVKPCSREQASHVRSVFLSTAFSPGMFLCRTNFQEHAFLKIKILVYLSPGSTDILHFNLRLLFATHSHSIIR